MKVGTLCYATQQGLGVLAKSFVYNGVVTDPFVVLHTSRPNMDWYPGAPSAKPTDLSFRRRVVEYVKGLDVLFMFETPFWWGVIEECRRIGVKTVLMPMYECMPQTWPAKPDLIINPSDLDQRCFPDGIRLNVPVDASTWRLRPGPVKTFVHNAGHHGLKGRNGTDELITAWPMVSQGARLILRTQASLTPKQLMTLVDCGNVDVRLGTVPSHELYAEGDCFVFPEKFNGLSLPLQEAYAAGMVVAATKRYPNTQWLPPDPLIDVQGQRPQRAGRSTMDISEAVIDPADIATKLNRLYGGYHSYESTMGRLWAEVNDWKILKPVYLDVLTKLVTS